MQKSSDEEMTKMCKEVEKYTKKIVDNAVNQNTENTVVKMLEAGKLTLQEIAGYCSISVDKVTSIAKNNNITLA